VLDDAGANEVGGLKSVKVQWRVPSASAGALQ
jgi:hypothetical protein